MRSRKKKQQLPSIRMLGRLEKGGVYVLKLDNWNCADYLGETLDGWFKIFEQKRLDITILVLGPDMELLDGRKLRKQQENPLAEGAGSPQTTLENRVEKLEHCVTCRCRILSCPERIDSSLQDHHFGEPDKDSQVDSDGKPREMVTNVDGNRVPKGSDADDRWGPYGTETLKKKPVNVNSNPPGEMFTTP